VSSPSHHHRNTQRRVVRILLGLAAFTLVIGIPLVVFDELRFNIARELNLIPGENAEKLASGDDGALLIVVPLGEYTGIGRERYAYRADYIARPADSGMQLSDIETGEVVDVPLVSIEFIANDPEGDHVLLRGPGIDDNADTAVVVDTQANEVDVLPEGELEPDLPGDWETETWQKITGTCDRVSPESKFIACFNRADAASYLAGDWQIDVQLFGDYQVSEPVYRGMGLFLPTVGFAHEDTWLYFQNETGIFRIEVPQSLQDRTSTATPAGAGSAP
jgi:hypothetical protein